MSFVVCTTDDGGSTGRLLKLLPMIGVGDLRKLLLSSILLENLERKYGLSVQEASDLLKMIHAVLNHRFPEKESSYTCVANPLLAIAPDLRRFCPKALADSIRELGTYVSPKGSGPDYFSRRTGAGELCCSHPPFSGPRAERGPLSGTA